MQLRIDSLRRSIQLCQERAENTGAQFSDSPRVQGNGNKIADNIEKKADFEAELLQLIDEFERFRIRAIREINRIPDSMYASVLIDKYINGYTWERVAKNIGFQNEDYVRKILHAKALESFEKNNPETTRKSPEKSLYFSGK